MMPIEARVNHRYSSLSTTERKVADYFLENIHTVFHMPISKLAEEAEVSQVAWVRFSQRIGFSGLKELRRNLYEQLSDSHQSASDSTYSFKDIEEFDDISSIITTIGNNSVQAIQDTVRLFDRGELETIADILIKAKHILLFGVGASGMVADDFATKLMRIGKRATFWRDTHIQTTYATTAMEGDVCVFFSHSGSTIEILEAFTIIQKKGLPSVSVTRAGGTPLSDQASYAISVSSPEFDIRSGATSSRLAHLVVVDILFTIIANKNYNIIKANLISSAAALKHKRFDSKGGT